MSPTHFPGYLRPDRNAPRGGRSLGWVAVLGGLAALAYLLLLSDSGLLSLQRHRTEVEKLDQDLARLAADQEHVRQQLAELERPGSFLLERVARERYGMIREGEHVIHVVEPRGEDPARLP